MLLIRKAAVLGAGRMGTAVAAHLANAGIPTLLLDLAPTELTEEEKKKGLDLTHPSVRNRLAEAGIAAAAKGRPAAFAHPEPGGPADPGQLRGRSAQAGGCRLGSGGGRRAARRQEGPARAGWRQHVGPKTIVSTNSSGLSVNAMAAGAARRPEDAASWAATSSSRPRYMYLLELIPGEKTDPAVVDGLKDFAELRLGKGVVLSNDTPNFVANRIGIFSTVYAINAMDKYGLTIEEVDAASGRALARSVTATYGTSNLAGTDVLSYAVASHYETAVDDEMREQWHLPQWILDMVGPGLPGREDRRQLLPGEAHAGDRPGHPGLPALAGPAAAEHRRGQQDLRPRGAGAEVHLLRRRGRPFRLGPSCGDLRLLRQPRPRDLRRHRRDRPGHALGLRLGPGSLRAVGRPGRQGDRRAHAGRRPGGPRMGPRAGRFRRRPHFYKREAGRSPRTGPAGEHKPLASAAAHHRAGRSQGEPARRWTRSPARQPHRSR